MEFWLYKFILVLIFIFEGHWRFLIGVWHINQDFDIRNDVTSKNDETDKNAEIAGEPRKESNIPKDGNTENSKRIGNEEDTEFWEHQSAKKIKTNEVIDDNPNHTVQSEEIIKIKTTRNQNQKAPANKPQKNQEVCLKIPQLKMVKQ